MEDGEKLLKRFEQLKTRRAVVEEEWRSAYRYTHPLRGVGLETMGTVSTNPTQQNASVAATNQAELMDSTGADSSLTLAAALQSGLTPSNSRWPLLDVDDPTDEERQWLDDAADSLWENIHASNFDAVSFDCMLDAVIAGMFPMFVDEAPGGGFKFEEWPLANTYFAASVPGGPIDTVHNEFALTAEQAVNEYGEEMVPEKVRECMKANKPDEMFTFVRAVYPRPGPHGKLKHNLPIASLHIEKDSKKVVRESGYHEMPVGVPRVYQVPGSAYAFGFVHAALPDLKTLNDVVRYDLANMDLALSGMWGAVDDGVLNPRAVRVGPRKVIVMSAKDNFFPLTPGGNFQVAVLKIEQLQRSIRKVLMADQLEPQQKSGQPATATEIMVRVELIRQMLGPLYGRMQAEYLQWLVKRCFGIAYRAGVFRPAPRSLLEKVVSVKYNSPIARAQKAVDVQAMDRYELSLGAQSEAGLSDAIDLYDWDEARRHRAELLGVPAKLIPDEDAVAETRAKRMKAQQQARQMEQAQQIAEAMPKAA